MRGFGIGALAVSQMLLLAAPAAAADRPDMAVAASESEGLLLVLSKTDGTMMVFEEPSHRLLATIPVGEEPHEVAVTPDGAKAYVSDVGERSVAVVDLHSYRVLKTIRADGLDRPHGLHVSRDGRRVLLTSEGSHRLYLIDAIRDVIDRALTTTQDGAHMVAVGKGGSKAYIANRGSGTLTIASAYALTIKDHIQLGDGPEGIAATPDGRWILVALQREDEVLFLAAGGLRVEHQLPVGRTPIRIAVTPDSATALVTNRGSGDVTVLDLVERQVVATISVGDRPGGIVTNARGTRAYVCNNGSGDVAVLSIADRKIIERIPAGGEPDGIAFVDAAGGKGRGGARGSG
jgi:YVTN family beta-propeller protein